MFVILFTFTGMAADRAEPSLSYEIARGLRKSIRENERQWNDMTLRRNQLPPLAPGRHGESLGFHSQFQDNSSDQLDILIDLGKEQSIDRIALFPVSTVFQGETIAGYGFPPKFQLETSVDPSFAESTLVYESTGSDSQARREYPVQVLASNLTTRYIRLRILKHWERPDGRILTALGELMVLSGGRNVAIEGSVEAESFNSLPDWSSANLIDGQTDLGLPISPEPSSSNGYLSMPSLESDELKWVQVDLPKSAIIEEVRLVPTQPLDAPSQYGHGFPRRFRVLASMNEDFSSPRVIADHTEAAFPNPGDNLVIVPGDGLPARHIRLEAQELWHITNKSFALAIAEMQVFENGYNIAMQAKVTPLDIGGTKPPFNQVWNPDYMIDGYSSHNRLIALDVWMDGLEERKLLDSKIRQLEIKNLQTAESTMLGLLLAGSSLVGALLAFIAYNRIRRRKLLLGKQRELRNRISRDLHDDLGSRLGGMRLISESILNDPELPATLREDIDMIYRASGEANDAMRDIVWLLDSREASRAKLVRHMRQLVPAVLGRLEFQFQTEEVPEQDLDFEFRRQVLFSFKECLGNVIKHADAQRVHCLIGGDEKRFRFEVKDDGKGFVVENSNSGHGLENLRTRAASIGGTVQINSQPGEGSQIILDTPIRLRR